MQRALWLKWHQENLEKPIMTNYWLALPHSFTAPFFFYFAAITIWNSLHSSFPLGLANLQVLSKYSSKALTQPVQCYPGPCKPGTDPLPAFKRCSQNFIVWDLFNLWTCLKTVDWISVALLSKMSRSCSSRRSSIIANWVLELSSSGMRICKR